MSRSRAAIGRLPGLLRRAGAHVLALLLHSGKAIVFSAALSVALDAAGLMEPLVKVSTLLVDALEAGHASFDTGGVARGPVVVTIDDIDYEARYAETSPLNRCVLAGDLQRVLAKDPRQVVVDLDLAPPVAPDPTQLACQQRLDRLLDANARRLTVLLPGAVKLPYFLDLKTHWMAQRCLHGLAFGQGRIHVGYGMAFEQSRDGSGRLAGVATGKGRDALCRQLLQARPWRESAQPALWAALHRRVGGEATEPMNYHAFLQRVGAPFSVSSMTFAQLPSLRGRTVFFGGNWGHLDDFQTPIGSLPGVAVHAARFVGLQHPVQPLAGPAAVLVDLVTALVLAVAVSGFWGIYADLCVYERKMSPAGKRLALASPAWVLFLVGYLMLTMALFAIARYVFVWQGLLIAPLVMALSMLLDGFVSGPREVIDRHLGEAPEHGQPAGESPSPESLRRTAHRALAALALVIVYVAVVVTLLVLGDDQLMFRLHAAFAIVVLVLLVVGLVDWIQARVRRGPGAAHALRRVPGAAHALRPRAGRGSYSPEVDPLARQLKREALKLKQEAKLLCHRCMFSVGNTSRRLRIGVFWLIVLFALGWVVWT